MRRPRSSIIIAVLLLVAVFASIRTFFGHPFLGQVPPPENGQCRDLVDNDGDGAVDALVESATSASSLPSQFVISPEFTTVPIVASGIGPIGNINPGEPNYHANGVYKINHFVQNHFCAAGTSCFYEDGKSVGADAETAQKICEYAGYANVAQISGIDYGSCADNWTSLWRSGTFTKDPGCTFPRQLFSIKCTGPIPQAGNTACSDTQDNDGDGQIDHPSDAGCASRGDQSEIPHDTDCSSPDDTTEGVTTPPASSSSSAGTTAAECADGIDNDGDTLVDFAVNLVQNADFEEPAIIVSGGCHTVYGNDPGNTYPPSIPGWKPDIYQVELQKCHPAAAGTQYAEVDATNTIRLQQDLTTIPGKNYEIRYAYALRPDAGAQSMGVYWNGQQVDTAGGTPQAGATGLSWVYRTKVVTAVGAQSTLGFSALDPTPMGAGNFLDDVSVSLVNNGDPECTSLDDPQESGPPVSVCEEPNMFIYNLQPTPFPDHSTPQAVTELRKLGYNITYHSRLTLPRLTTAFARQFPLLWIMDGCGRPEEVISQGELAIIKDYYLNGGHLVLSPGVPADPKAPHDTCHQRLNQIAKNLGIHYDNAPAPKTNACAAATGNDPLMALVSQIYQDAGAAVTLSGSVVWKNVVADSPVTVATMGSTLAIAKIAETDGHGAGIFLSSSNLLAGTCNSNAAYANLPLSLGMQKGCSCPSSGTGACVTQCNDRIDNDGIDGIDLADSGCQNAQDISEQDDVTPIAGGTCSIVSRGASGLGQILVNCPENYVVMGGGWRNYDGLDFGADVSRPLSTGSGWECEKNTSNSRNSGQCQAVCCRSDTVDTTVITKTGPLNASPIVECPAGYFVTGGGYHDRTPKKDEDILRPEANGEDDSGRWHCLDDDSTNPNSTCYAVCAKLKTGDAVLRCETPEIAGQQDINNKGIGVSCPANTIVTGGGFIDNSTGNDDQDDNYPYDNGWHCFEDYNDSPPAESVCYARCCEMPLPPDTTLTASITGPTAAVKGETATYRITMKNIDVVAAKNAFIRSQFSLTGSTLVSVPSECTDHGWNQNGGYIVQCHNNTLAAGAEVSFDLTFNVPMGAPCTFYDEVGADADNALPTDIAHVLTSTGCPGSSSSTATSDSSSTSDASTSSSSDAFSTSSSSADPASSSSSEETLPSSSSASPAATSSSATAATSSASSLFLEVHSSSAGSQNSSWIGTEQCPRNGCADGGDVYCPLIGLRCQPSGESPCFSCAEEGTVSTIPLLPNDSLCTEDRECQSLLCLGEVCTPCTQATDCNGNSICLGGTCAPPSLLRYLPLAAAPQCGNGQRDDGEECDEGGRNSDAPGARCRASCRFARCGDGIADPPQERCDDGNQEAGDGCSPQCALERGFTVVDGRILATTLTAQPLLTQAELLITADSSHAPVGNTGPAAAVMVAAGAAAGVGWVRRFHRAKRENPLE